MSWELHLTVRGAAATLDAFAARVGARRLRLELTANGATHLEEMLTARMPEDAATARAAAEALGRDACASDIVVVRTKIEAPIEAAVPALYLEHHVRVRAPRAALPELAAIATRHDAHVSRQPRFQETDREERYLTVRFRADEAARETTALDTLLRALSAAGFEVTKVERERIVLDQRGEAA